MNSFLENFNANNLYEIDIFQVFKKSSFQKNTINIVKPIFLKTIDAYLISKNWTTTISNLEEDSDFKNVQEFSFSTPEDLELNANYFYVFVLNPEKNKSNYEKENFNWNDKDIFLLKEKVQAFSFENIDLQQNFEFNLVDLKTYKEIENINFIFTSANLSFENFNLNFENNLLVNSINFYDSAKNQEVNFDYLSNKKPLLVYANPIQVNKKNLNLFFWSFSGNSQIYLNSIKNFIFFPSNPNWNANVLDNIENCSFDLANYSFADVKNLLIELIQDTEIFYSQNAEAKKRRFGDILPSKIEELIDYKVQNFKVNFPEKSFVLSQLLLSLSSQIKSSFCWKGGLNNEVELFAFLTLKYKTNKFYLKSKFLEIDRQKNFVLKNSNNFLNSNLYNFQNYFVSLPILPEKIEAQDFSQNPVDFNDKTFNLNYPFYLFLTQDEFNSFQNQSSRNPQTQTTLKQFFGQSNFDGTDLRFRNEIPFPQLKNPHTNLQVFSSAAESNISAFHYLISEIERLNLINPTDSIVQVAREKTYTFVPSPNGTGTQRIEKWNYFISYNTTKFSEILDLKPLLIKNAEDLKKWYFQNFGISQASSSVKILESVNLSFVKSPNQLDLNPDILILRGVWINDLELNFGNQSILIKNKNWATNPILKIQIW